MELNTKIVFNANKLVFSTRITVKDLALKALNEIANTEGCSVDGLIEEIVNAALIERLSAKKIDAHAKVNTVSHCRE